jgi:hypothetical protein
LPRRIRPRTLLFNQLGRLPVVGVRFNAVTRKRYWLLSMLPAQSVGAEIGVWRGDFAAAILAKTKPRVLHLIDPWRSATDPKMAGVLYDVPQAAMDEIAEAVRVRFERQTAAGTVVVHRATSVVAASSIADASLDWVYIDGDHSYAGVKTDLETYLPKVRRGGLLCGDDYDAGGRFKGSVKRAVDEFVAEGAVRMVVQRTRQYVLEKI